MLPLYNGFKNYISILLYENQDLVIARGSSSRADPWLEAMFKSVPLPWLPGWRHLNV